MWKEAVMVWCKVLSQNLHGETEQNTQILCQDIRPVSVTRIEVVASQLLGYDGTLFRRVESVIAGDVPN
jgi:hypothetical protein